MKRARKDRIICRMIEAARGPSSCPELDLSSKDLRKVKRHAKTIERMSVSIKKTEQAIKNLHEIQTNVSTFYHSDLFATINSSEELKEATS